MTAINPGTSQPTQQTELPPGFVNENGEINVQDPQIKQHLSSLFKDFFANHLSHADGDTSSSTAFEQGPPPPGEGGTKASDFSAMYARFEAGGDTFEVGMTQVMELLHELGKENKKASTEAREAKRDAEMNKLMDAADKIREAADLALAGGIASGAISIAQGAMNFAIAVGSAALSVGQGINAAKAGPAPAASAPKPTIGGHRAPGGAAGNSTGAGGGQAAATGWKSIAMNGMMNQSPVLAGIGQAVTGVTGGVGKMIEAGIEHAKTNLQADQKELEAKAATDRAQADEMQELKQSSIDLQREVRQKLAEMNDINNRTMNRILQG